MSLYAMIPDQNMQILAINVDESLDGVQWSPGTYEPGAERTYGGKVWQAVVQTTATPGANADWKYIEHANSVRFIDEVISTQTVATATDGSIEMTVKGSGSVLTMLGIDADSVFINGTRQDMRKPVNDMLDYYQQPIEYQVDVSEQITFRADTTIRLTKNNGAAKLGKLLVARRFYVGQMVYAPQVTMTDYSLLKRDAFGYVSSIVQRGYSKDLDAEVHLSPNTAAAQFNAVAELRGRAVLYVNDTLNISTYAVMRRVRWRTNNARKAVISVFAEGLI